MRTIIGYCLILMGIIGIINGADMEALYMCIAGTVIAFIGCIVLLYDKHAKQQQFKAQLERALDAFVQDMKDPKFDLRPSDQEIRESVEQRYDDLDPFWKGVEEHLYNSKN